MAGMDLRGNRVSATTEGGGRVWPAPQGQGEVREMSHRQYAGLVPDRHRRFYTRGLRRRGVYFGDPLLILLWADAEWACDDSPCP
jgi:hypothetical protein